MRNRGIRARSRDERARPHRACARAVRSLAAGPSKTRDSLSVSAACSSRSASNDASSALHQPACEQLALQRALARRPGCSSSWSCR